MNLTLDAEFAKTVRELCLSMSRLADSAVSQAAKIDRNRLWRQNNQALIDTYAEEVERDGLA
ncbi:MAG: type II toxin-antitoxin system CcdA family antitoxin [Rhodobacteraceae bacterium]|nr:type II toxin-antitoxin system CcdA family antitoxin [Paracoccaceae bacterium]